MKVQPGAGFAVSRTTLPGAYCGAAGDRSTAPFPVTVMLEKLADAFNRVLGGFLDPEKFLVLPQHLEVQRFRKLHVEIIEGFWVAFRPGWRHEIEDKLEAAVVHDANFGFTFGIKSLEPNHFYRFVYASTIITRKQ